MLRPYSCQLLVGAKHLEDKLLVIAKNSSPNASPVQLFVVRYIFFATDQLPMTNDQRLKTLFVTTPTGSLWYIASFYFAIVVVCRHYNISSI